MITRRLILSAPALVVPGARAWAQNWPTGPVTLVVPFPPGGSIDVVMRAMAPTLQERLGKPVVIENRAGAGGVIATAAVAKAPPDGQTVLAAASFLASNPAMFKTLPFDTLKDLQAISLTFRTPLILVVNPALPVTSVPELVALLKRKPGEVSFAHAGPGSALHLAAELFQSMTGTRMSGVTYRGAPLALTDVIANHVSLMFADAGTVVEQIREGRVRALGVTSTTRVPAAPDVPTIAEAGVPGYEAVGWTMTCVPSATPKPIVDRLNTELKTIAAQPNVRKLIVQLGTIPVDSPSPDETQKFLASEIDRWGKIIERAGVAKSQ